jgi:hypothetical protein
MKKLYHKLTRGRTDDLFWSSLLLIVLLIFTLMLLLLHWPDPLWLSLDHLRRRY